MIIPQLERSKINLDLPIFTLDVNQVALKEPNQYRPEMHGLASLEWNYFMVSSVELCVTPETAFEITKDQPLSNLPYTAYKRFKKTEFFKSRPAGVTLDLTEQDAMNLWYGIREILWPTEKDNLNQRQKSDVNQLFYHSVTSGSAVFNAAFLTIDNHFLHKKNEIYSQLGVTIFTPNEAWEEYRSEYNLYNPNKSEVERVYQNQQEFFSQLNQKAECIP